MNKLTHRGFTGSVDISLEDDCLYGKIEFISDLVTFEGKDIEEIKKSFCEAVDDYIDICKEVGKEPEKPFKGSFNIRTGTDLHKKSALQAKVKGISLNEFVCTALDNEVQKDKGNEIHIHHHKHEHVQSHNSTVEAFFIDKNQKGDRGWKAKSQIQ